MGELCRVVSDLAAVAAKKADMQGQLQAEQQRAPQQASATLDLAQRQRLLGWLQQVRDDIHALDERTTALEETRKRVLGRCMERQREVEVLDRHCEEQVKDFVQAEGARQAKEVDQDWLSRARWVDGTRAGNNGLPHKEGES
jgi:chromosome segregation ATPase